MRPAHALAAYGWAMLVALISPCGVALDTGTSGVTQLDPITVTPRIDPLDEAYERLRRMLVEPCHGCPPLIQVDRESIYSKTGKAIGALTGFSAEPPQMNHQERQDFHLANDWRKADRFPEEQ